MDEKFLRIRELSEKYRGYTASNLSRLIKIRSFSTKEADVQEEVRRQMEEAGFEEVRTDGLGNVLGRIGRGKRVIAIDGHIDTVEAGNRANWSFDPYIGDIAEGFVRGRGATDQKGGVAAFITAGRIIRELDLADDLTIWFVASVIEEDCDGLCWKYIIEEDEIKPEAVLLTEPTNLTISRGQRGRMEIDVHFHGISSHGSAPERGRNAIYMASRTALAIERLNSELTGGGFLGKGSITVTEISSSSPSLCAVPDYARIHIDRRLTEGETSEKALAEIKKITADYNANVEVPDFLEKAYTGLEYGMEKYYPAWLLPENHELVRHGAQAYASVFGDDPVIDKWIFSTNGIMTCGVYGIPTIGFGPGNEVMAHAPDEKVAVNDLVKASAFYAAYIAEFNP